MAMISFRIVASRRSVNLRKKTNISFIRCSGSATKLYEPADKETQRIEKLTPLKKAPQKLPFAKNFFCGQYDTDLLAYPEFLGERRLKLLDANTEILKTMVAEHVDPLEIDRNCNIPEKLLQILRDMKLFGVIAPAKYGGLELTHTERARIYEVLAEDTSLAAMLFSHETLGHKVITEYGTEQQKEKYLKKLVSGKSVAAYCANELECGADIASMSTLALKTGDDAYLLNGSKTWVMNGDSADVLLVFAKIKTSKQVTHPANRYYKEYDAEEEETEEPLVDDVGVFLVDKNAPGVTVSERKDTLGVRGLHMCDITFKDVLIPVQNVLGDNEKQGYDIAKRFIAEDRYMIGVFALNILRKMQNDVTRYSINRKLFGDNLCNYGLTQIKIARATSTIYAIESVIYYTCGLLDMYEDQDCEIENAIVKVFASEMAWQTVTDGMQLLGGQAYIRNQPYEKYFRDLKVLSLFDVSNEVLKMYIALGGLKYIANQINDDVVRTRNPYNHPSYIFKKFFKTFRVDINDPKLKLKLYENLHPTLCTASDELERTLLRFEQGVSMALARYGIFLVNDQFALNRIADAVIYLYAMTAIISRASRSYCIGTKNADDEMVIVEALVREYSAKFDEICEGLIEGETYVNDTFHKKIAKRTIQSKGYQLEHPLKLNY